MPWMFQSNNKIWCLFFNNKGIKPVKKQVLAQKEEGTWTIAGAFLILRLVIPCLEFLISSYFPISPLPTPFEDTAKLSLRLQGGATSPMINGLARADGRGACFIHEGFHFHASEILAPVTDFSRMLMPTTGLASQLRLTATSTLSRSCHVGFTKGT